MSEDNASQRREGVQVIARAAEMLRRLAAEPDGLTLIELAGVVSLPRSTAHRIVGALSREGFIRAAPSGKLRIGSALIGIAVASRRDIRHEAAPFIERLSHELRETVDLAVLDGSEVLFIDQYTSRRTLRVVTEIGAHFPLYCTASGKAMLSVVPLTEAERLLPRQLAPMTENTITDRRLLFEEIERVRESGIAFDHEELTIGIAAAAVAVRDSVGTVAAISVIIPAVRFHDSRDQVGAALLRTKAQIQAAFHGG